jgi:hypothetical protein
MEGGCSGRLQVVLERQITLNTAQIISGGGHTTSLRFRKEILPFRDKQHLKVRVQLARFHSLS